MYLVNSSRALEGDYEGKVDMAFCTAYVRL